MASERGPGQWPVGKNGKDMEISAIVGDSPVQVNQGMDSGKAGHVQSCLNMGGPPSKPKYSLATDSEQVP